MKLNFIYKTLLAVTLVTFGINVNAQIKYDERGFLTFGSVTSHHDGSKYYDLTIKGNVFLKGPANANNFFQIDTNPAATRLASHYDQVVFYNTQTGVFNSIQVKNVYNYSDANAKTNIRQLNQGLGIIQQLNPVAYNFADNSDNIKFKRGGNADEFGLLAQEVEKILPDVVLTDPDGKKLINYNALIPFLIKAIKELNDKLEANGVK